MPEVTRRKLITGTALSIIAAETGVILGQNLESNANFILPRETIETNFKDGLEPWLDTFNSVSTLRRKLGATPSYFYLRNGSNIYNGEALLAKIARGIASTQEKNLLADGWFKEDIIKVKKGDIMVETDNYDPLLDNIREQQIERVRNTIQIIIPPETKNPIEYEKQIRDALADFAYIAPQMIEMLPNTIKIRNDMGGLTYYDQELVELPSFENKEDFWVALIHEARHRIEFVLLEHKNILVKERVAQYFNTKLHAIDRIAETYLRATWSAAEWFKFGFNDFIPYDSNIVNSRYISNLENYFKQKYNIKLLPKYDGESDGNRYNQLIHAVGQLALKKPEILADDKITSLMQVLVDEIFHFLVGPVQGSKSIGLPSDKNPISNPMHPYNTANLETQWEAWNTFGGIDLGGLDDDFFSLIRRLLKLDPWS